MGIAGELRHKHIMDALTTKGRIYVKDVSKKLKVTEVTIRRDLALLNEKGLIKKTYGGAVLNTPDFNASVKYREKRKTTAKKIVGKLAGKLVKDGDIIFLESGSTCYEIIPYLADKKNLTVLVNSIYLMKRLHELTKHKIIIIGGQYRPETMDMVGPGAEAAIAQLSGFKAFTGADDIAVDAGISGADVVTVGFAKMVLKKASTVIFVGDHTKFDNPALYKIADLDQINYIVTDTKPAAQWRKLAIKKQITLIYPN